MIFPVQKKHRLGLRFGALYGSFLSRLLGNKHQGLDIIPETKEEVPVLAISKGMVVRIGRLGSCGLSVDYTIQGYKVRYCHLKSITASLGAVKGGQEIGIMGSTGLSYPANFRHLHWAFWKHGILIDPLTLIYTNEVTTGSFNLVKEFKSIWQREGATGEIAFYQRRLDRGSIKTLKELHEALRKWRDIVYPNGLYSVKGDGLWFIEKLK